MKPVPHSTSTMVPAQEHGELGEHRGDQGDHRDHREQGDLVDPGQRPKGPFRSPPTKAGSPSALRARYELLISTPKEARSFVLQPGGDYVMGRDRECDIVIPEASVSRRHGRIRSDGSLRFYDLGSANGTLVDGAPCLPRQERPLHPGSVLQLGRARIVVHRLEERDDTLRLGDEGPIVDARASSPPTHARPSSASSGPLVADPTMQQLYAMLDAVAPSPIHVLVLGETGVGKEVFAREVHRRSPRASKPFLALNCAALPESMLEAELFGYEKGAFTGAAQAKAGLFESAHGGTVFLDEIGDMPLTTQAKLLRFLESGEFLRLGSLKARRVDTRFVSATHFDLRKAVAEGRFRADLFFRIDGITFQLPPLRARKAEIGALAERFAAAASERLRRPPPRLSPAARTRLEQAPWPGNVRELRNAVERALVLCTGPELLPHHFVGLSEAPMTEEAPLPTARPGPPSSGPRRLQDEVRALEKQRIVDALARWGGNQSQAARHLSISRATLIARIEAYGLSRPRKARPKD